MKNVLLTSVTFFVFIFISCNKHELPTVIAPFVDVIQIKSTVIIGFEITADAGYHSYDVSAEKGKAVYHTDLGQGAVQGWIYIKYTASSEIGIDYITFVVHDLDGKHASVVIKLEIVAYN